MTILIDSREKKNQHITLWFELYGVKFKKTDDKGRAIMLGVGDYMCEELPNVFIERKNSWLELAGNVGRGHETFRRELERLKQSGGKLYILIEEIIPLAKWYNTRSKMKAEVMKKILDAWGEKYDIKIIQCQKLDAGQKIIEILKGKEK
jgi:ERCC4-type nuclease